jgi:hypothetical protein
VICGCADLRGGFTGQKGGVREVPGGGSSRGICPQGVSVISTLKPYMYISSQKEIFLPMFCFDLFLHPQYVLYVSNLKILFTYW